MYDHSQLSLADTLIRACRRNPEKVGLVFDERAWTYKELVIAVEQLAAEFARRGVRHGDRVLVRASNSDLYVIIMFACFRMGAVHVPMNVGFKAEEGIEIVRRTTPALLITDDLEFLSDLENVVDQPWFTNMKLMGTAETLRFNNVLLDTVLSAVLSVGGETPVEHYEPVMRDDIAQIIFTSGTTSAPKGAMMSHGALTFHYASAIIALNHRSDDRILSALPLYHAGQMHSFTGPGLMVGAKLVICEKPDPQVVCSLIDKHSINNFFAPPTAWISILNDSSQEEYELSSLQKAQYGASIMPSPILERLRKRFKGVEFYNAFGQTEAGPITTVLGPEGHDISPASAGVPVPFVDVRIVNEQFEDVVVGEVGEIVYRSPQLFSGYLDDPEATKNAYVGEWFKSGDLGRQDEHLNIHIVDRVKDVINTGGVLVSSREVEEHIYSLPQVAEVAAVGVPDPKWVEAVAAFIVLHPGIEISSEEVVAHCKAGLAGFKVPKRVHFVKELPKSGAGKILKRSLRDDSLEKETTV